MYGFPLAISCFIKTSNISRKFVKYTDVTLLKAITIGLCVMLDVRCFMLIQLLAFWDITDLVSSEIFH